MASTIRTKMDCGFNLVCAWLTTMFDRPDHTSLYGIYHILYMVYYIPYGLVKMRFPGYLHRIIWCWFKWRLIRSWMLTTTFENINFSSLGPDNVCKTIQFIWMRHHPKCRPETISFRLFCSEFDTSIFLNEFRIHSTYKYRLNNGQKVT